MDKRIFVEKKADFRVKSRSLLKELQHNIQLKTLNDLRIVQVYDVFNLAEDLFARAEKYIFSEQVTDTVLDEATVKTDLEKYSTLVPGCGSCITEMNSIYPELIISANEASRDLIKFYQKNQIPL